MTDKSETVYPNIRWQKIEHCPKDYKEYLVWDGYIKIASQSEDYDLDSESHWMCGEYWIEPIFWMPLPDAPKIESTNKDEMDKKDINYKSNYYDRKKWYFTFGTGHMFPQKYVAIHGTHDECVSVMYFLFGDKWCRYYNNIEEFGADKYCLEPIVIPEEITEILLEKLINAKTDKILLKQNLSEKDD